MPALNPVEVYKLRNTLNFEPFSYDYKKFSVNYFRSSTSDLLNKLVIPIKSSGVQDSLPEVFIQAPFLIVRSDVADRLITTLNASHTRYSKTIFTCESVTYYGIRAWDNFSLNPNALIFRAFTSRESEKDSYLQYYSSDFFRTLRELKFDSGIEAVPSTIYYQVLGE